MRLNRKWLGVTALATLSLSSNANALLFRSYLSVNGLDSNPCTVQQPCRLLPAALAAVNDGGEVWIVDSANFNNAPVNIDKSVSILAIPGALGSVIGTGGDAIVINTPGVKVALRNLKLLNFSAGANGINMTNGARLKVVGCEIAGFAEYNAAGIKIATPAILTVVDTVIRDNYNGMLFDNGAKGDVSRTTLVGNSYAGIWINPTAASNISVTVTDTVASGGSFAFAVNEIAGATSKMTISRSTASHNSVGFTTNGGLMIVSGSVASGNTSYGFWNYVGTFRSLGDNTVVDNGLDTSGVITATLPK
jgi:hypothetical protein